MESAARSDSLIGGYVTATSPRSSFDYLKLFAWVGATLASWALVIGLGWITLAFIP